MAIRDDFIIDSEDDVEHWLQAYRHTITDVPALKIIEIFEQGESERIRELIIEAEVSDDGAHNAREDLKVIRREMDILQGRLNREFRFECGAGI